MLPKQPNKSLIDGLRCLQGLVSCPGPIGISDLAKSLDMEPTRAHRLLRTLTHMGYARQNSSRKYVPGPAIYPMTAQTLYASRFMSHALEPLEHLRRKLPYIVAMGVLWNRTVSYLYHAYQDTPLEKAIGTFGFWDATNSGIGMAVLAQKSNAEVKALFAGHKIPQYPQGIKSLLAELARIRRQGYAFIPTNTGENHYTLALASASNPFLALGISGRIPSHKVSNLLTHLQETLSKIDETASDSPMEVQPSRIGTAV